MPMKYFFNVALQYAKTVDKMSGHINKVDIQMINKHENILILISQ